MEYRGGPLAYMARSFTDYVMCAYIWLSRSGCYVEASWGGLGQVGCGGVCPWAGAAFLDCPLRTPLFSSVALLS